MKKRIMAFLLSFAMILTLAQPLAAQAAEASGYDYEVITPDGYDDDHAYPVIYVMPEDGYAQDESGITEKLQNAMTDGTSTQMIIVEPSFGTDADLYAAMEAIVAEVDEKYNTIADADHRAIVGTGVGGYLAYILGLTEEAEETPEEVAPAAEEEGTEETPIETVDVATLTAPKLFKYVASTRGDFVSEANGWCAAYGDVYTYMTEIGAANLANFYTYIDSPVDDEWSDMVGSTNDIGQLIIQNGTDAAACEFTTRLGEFTDEFLTESVNRIANRATNGMLGAAVSGTVALKETVLAVDAKTFEVDYTVNTTDIIADYSAITEEIEVIVEVLDPDTDEILASETVTTEVAETIEGTVELEKNISGSSATVALSVKLLDAKLELATATALNVRETVVDGDYQFIDLMGDWYFHYLQRSTAGKGYEVVREDIESGAYTEWSVVQPALAWWTLGFGDLVSDFGTGAWADYGFVGEGWYVRTFDIPENFDSDDLIVSTGNWDDRGQVYINGKLVGETGMVNGETSGESAWEEYSYFEVDPAILNIGGTNTIVVRCYNDGMGGGGWYSGPVALYSRTAFEADDSTVSLFIEESFESKYAASASKADTETIENDYLIYLPEGYEESDKYYPTVYLLHQYNSTHKSYMTDDVDRLVAAAVEEGILDEMIIVVPNSQESSWWRGDWMKMVTEELVPLIDSKYRTIDDARYRFTAGCSMGGQGAYGVALTNPDLFSGAISFFGAFSMGGDASPNTIASNESAKYMDYFAMYFICGNQDIYKFGNPAVELHQQLLAMDVEHEFFIENGGHDSEFYLPHFIEGFEYIRNNMYKSSAAVDAQLDGTLSVTKNNVVKANFTAARGIEKYFNSIPASSYTKDTTPDLSIPLTVEVEQNGEVVFTAVERDFTVSKSDKSELLKYDLSDFVKAGYEYTVTFTAAIFDRVVELDTVVVNEGNVYDGAFEDVTVDDWYYEAVEYVAANDIMEGTGDGTVFTPDGTLTREQFATVIYRLAGEPEVTAENEFTDVEAGEWYTDAVVWAADVGVVNGVNEEEFGVGQEITREQIAAMLHRFIVSEGYAEPDEIKDISGYVDAEDVSNWAKADVAWAVEEGIIAGNTKGELNPLGNATRAECAVILMRVMETFE